MKDEESKFEERLSRPAQSIYAVGWTIFFSLVIVYANIAIYYIYGGWISMY